MLGWDYSSKFSPWLAWGCMSARSIYYAIRRYEEDEGANDSTYWLIFELLWRDYFRFVSMQHGKQHWLIDYDPCSNTGNWLYVSGIGNDPRPQRKFDVDWQAERYDPMGAFQSHWNRLGEVFPLDPNEVP